MTAELARTDRALLTDIRVTDSPSYGRTVSGYGGKIPTRYLVRYAGRWRRVYAMQYGNAGSVYLVVNGRDTFLDTDTEHALMAAGS